jgi:DNA-binding MurR/RpiR family transcriptional regulator
MTSSAESGTVPSRKPRSVAGRPVRRAFHGPDRGGSFLAGCGAAVREGVHSPAAIELLAAIEGTVPSIVSASTNPSASNEALARLRQQLAAGRALSPKYAALADFVLREPDRVAFMTAVELARAAGVSEATVIRFAASLSFSGYPEFQREFQRVLQAELTTVRRLQHALGADDADPEGTIAGRELANIGATFDALDPADVRAVAQLLLAAPALRVVGLRASVCLADYVAYQLAQILPDVRPVTSGGSDAIEQLLATPAAVVVAFAFPRYPRETVELVRAARDAGRAVVAITDGFGSPICDGAERVLLAPVSSPTFVDLYAAPLAVAAAIVYELSRLDETRALAALSEFERRADQARLYFAAARSG